MNGKLFARVELEETLSLPQFQVRVYVSVREPSVSYRVSCFIEESKAAFGKVVVDSTTTSGLGLLLLAHSRIESLELLAQSPIFQRDNALGHLLSRNIAIILGCGRAVEPNQVLVAKGDSGRLQRLVNRSHR